MGLKEKFSVRCHNPLNLGCMAIFIVFAALPPSRLQPPPPSRPSRAGCPSPAIGSIRALRAGLRPAGCRQGCASRWRAGVAGDGLQGAGRPRCSRAGCSPGGQHEAGGQTRARTPREGDKGARGATRAVKRSLNFLLCCRCFKASCYFSSALGGVHIARAVWRLLWRQTSRSMPFHPCGCRYCHTLQFAHCRDERDNRRLTMGKSESSPPLLDG